VGTNSGLVLLKNTSNVRTGLLTAAQLANIHGTYKPGRRVRFLGFGEPDPGQLRPGTLGTIRMVDDLGTVHVDWDSGVRLGCVVCRVDSRRTDRLELLDDAR
jgi:hypothetical protein